MDTIFGGGSTASGPLDKCCENFEAFNIDFLDGLGMAGGGVADQLKDVFDNEGSAVANDIADVLKDDGGDFVSGLSNVLNDGINGLSDILTSIFSAGGSSGSGGGDLISSLVGGAFSIFGGGGALPHGNPFHEGGVVGFNGAPRYHTGGISGLRPDEVPAILQRGEEVLTRNDSRHRDNGGRDRGNVINMTNNFNGPVTDPKAVERAVGRAGARTAARLSFQAERNR